jgi:hypothetical protein
MKNFLGDWGLGIGDWGLGIGPIPNPQSPIPNPDYDAIFNGFFFFVMFLFFVEFSASIWVKPNYFRSFFFWLDLFASLSMVLEIDWILYPIVEFVIE